MLLSPVPNHFFMIGACDDPMRSHLRSTPTWLGEADTPPHALESRTAVQPRLSNQSVP